MNGPNDHRRGDPGSNDMLSIEFGHLYGNQISGQEQAATARTARGLIAQHPGSWHAVVLVDEYNAASAGFDIPRLVNDLTTAGLGPDGVFFESDLVPAATGLLPQITSQRVRSRAQRYLDTHDKIGCSLLTAAWYLTRLGILPSTELRCRATDTPLPAADTLVNVLASSYRSVEAEVDEILRHTPYATALAHISRAWVTDSDD